MAWKYRTRILRSTAWGAALATALLLFSATSALAARGAGPQGKPGKTSTATGNDISYPQCGGAFPTGQAFGIVGVNDGLANTANPCLGPYQGGGVASSELYWAATSSGLPNAQAGSQPKAGLYVNTADPGNAVADWPNSGTSPPYGACGPATTNSAVGADSQACAWEYGYQRAKVDVTLLINAADALGSPVSAAPSSYPWWLDVETANSWQTGAPGELMNVADLQGMIYYLNNAGVSQIGIYSTSSQWQSIVGTPSLGSFPSLPDWIPGARSLSAAESNCSQPGFTGRIEVTQWFSRPYDADYACP